MERATPIPIKRDKNGFATDESLDAIMDSVPCIILSTYDSYGDTIVHLDFIEEDGDLADWRGDIERKPSYFAYIPINLDMED